MNQRIRVLYFIRTLDVGGTEGQLVQLVTRLNRRDFEPVVCCISSGGPYVSALGAAGIPVEIMNLRDLGILQRPHVLLRDLFGVVQFVRRIRPDVVHGFLFWAYVVGTIAAWVTRVPVIVSSRRSLGHFKAGKAFHLLLERVINRMTRVWIANSEAVRQDVIRQEKVSTERILVIRNGLDVRRFDVAADGRFRESLHLEKRSPVIGVIANFIPYKGHRFFLDAWATVLEKCPDGVALLVGDGPLGKELETKVEETGLCDSVRFLGTRQDVPELLALMDLVVHPSLEEGFSNAILEAMAAGKPVVATNVGGNPEAVINGETGLLVRPSDSRALAEAMLWMIDHPEEAIRFGRAGRKRVEEDFEISRVVREYEQLYERLVTEKRPCLQAAGRS